jgi:hypothetical protein
LTRRTAVLVHLLAGLLFAGCGLGAYEERLGRTRELFEYHNALNQNLQGVWSSGDLGISLRVPRGYNRLPAPPPPKVLEDGSVEVVADTRHPGYLGIELPGLVEAWQMPGVGSIYLCSNHDRFLAQQSGGTAGDPELFFADLEAVLQSGLRFALETSNASSPSQMNAKFLERIPPAEKFAIPKEFTSIAISAGDLDNVAPLMAQVYEHQAGPIQVAVVCIYLKAASQDPGRTLRLALETLQVEPQAPKPATRPGGARNVQTF